ncbi:uncharacterized protein C8Q71DRAFT_863007 [Rhodofomes roseus]|uniref:Uncharacterized protein n=1 Tax=Rhodofomes roseus TaxID=34475 RepID=A0ABQ8JZW1_9APHY|nr:uncharacterized protein C8Q71DRAFT_863007 [Rhodofomes roseus]KAH9829925.1 hypothetical protein C8Q71DRAFT_863007 [Rhodofomes roseus]
MLNRWVVVVSGARMNEELLGLGDDRMSFDEALHELVDPELTISWEAYKYPIHVDAMKQWLPRNSARLFPAILEEVERALEELIPDSETGAHVMPICIPPEHKADCLKQSGCLSVAELGLTRLETEL